jgi:ribulose 1,5-bisphosphate synthetase/thiazole synthase
MVVVGGGPAGAIIAANDLFSKQLQLPIGQARNKPCGGAVPPQMLVDF